MEMNVLMVRMKELGWYVSPVTYVPTYQTSIGERLNVVLSNKELVSEWHSHCKMERDLKQRGQLLRIADCLGD